MKRCIYDFNPMRPDAWIRLRDDGQQSTLTIKERSADTVDGTKELEVVVSSFEDMNAIMERLGYTSRLYQENRRRSFVLDDVQIEIDEWPMIPPYLEIE
jgi:adenylate cyclase, class 2